MHASPKLCICRSPSYLLYPYYLEYLEVFKQANLVVYYACLSDIEHYASFKWLLLRNGIVLAL